MALAELDQSSIERQQLVTKLPLGARVHLLGICGSGMAAVATLLKTLGYYVTGSDQAFYPPMGDVVRSVANELFEGYKAENLSVVPDLIVIGNSISRGNVEVEYVLSQGLPYASMPEVFGALLIGSREACRTSIVVAGTHGKTTTTTLIASMLEQAGKAPGYFIGGIPLDLPTNVRCFDQKKNPQDRVVVLEGDEYDSAFFAKWPKFHSYRPDVLVLTSLEFDHGDIYASTEEIEIEFARLIARVPTAGTIIVSDGYPSLKNALARAQADRVLQAPVYFYGEGTNSQFRLVNRQVAAQQQSLAFDLNGENVFLTTSLTGKHNALNLLAAATVGKFVGLTPISISSGLAVCRGVLRRQTIVFSKNGIIVVEDFAHHPTAVTETLCGLRDAYPGKRLVAVFEPRSNTSRRGFFQSEYEQSFAAADVVVLKEVTEQGGYSNTEKVFTPLDVKKLVAKLTAQGKVAYSFGSVLEIKEFLLTSTKSDDVVVIMSNGDFGGLIKAFIELLARR